MGAKGRYGEGHRTYILLVEIPVILLSNGHFKFILGPAAHEIQKRERLAGFITGGYPTKRIKWLVSRLGLEQSKIVRRMLERDEALPEAFIHSLWLSEFMMQAGVVFLRFPGMARRIAWMNNCAMALYARQAAYFVENSEAGIYHYRSGYGRQSVQVAKAKGMIAICDHSLVHPAVLDYLVANKGNLPGGKINSHLNKMWTGVLRDIDQADHVVVNSDFVKTTFVNQGVNPSKVHVIYTGVDDAFLDRIPKRANRANHKLPVRLMFAGSLGERKGGEELINALDQLMRLPWKLEIIVNIESGIASKYKEFLSNTKVKISGLVPISELPRRMCEADIFIFPSLAEGSARVVFMALACGCYVITTPNSGSIVQDGVHGRLVPAGDVDALSEAIRKAMENRDQLAMIGQQNAVLIRTSYKQSDYGDNLIKLYDRLLNHCGSNSPQLAAI